MEGSLDIPELPPARLPPERWDARALTQLGSAVDATLLRAMQMAVDALLMPAPEDLPELRVSAEMFLDPELQREPGRFFAFPEEVPRPCEVSSGYWRRIGGGVAVGREFRSDYRAYTSPAPSDPEPADGDRIRIEHWLHERKRSRGTVLALHGFTMGRPRIDAIALFAGQWFRRGLDVALMTLPHHGARTPRGARFSGEHFAVPNVARLAEAVRQAIYEIRLVQMWLRERSGAPVGLVGLSLGGYLSSLMAGLYDDLDFVVPMAPPVCMGDLAWRFFRRSRRYRREAPPAFSQQELRIAFRAHSPLAHAPRRFRRFCRVSDRAKAWRRTRRSRAHR